MFDHIVQSSRQCDLQLLRVIFVIGDDTYGRKVIVFSACKLPNREEFGEGNKDPHGRLLQ